MMPIVNTVAYDDFLLLDYASPPNPITGKVTADFSTHIAYLKSNPATTAPMTITEAGGPLAGTGTYIPSFTPTADGDWGMLVIYTAISPPRRLTGTISVDATGSDPLGALLSAYANSPGTAGKALLQIGSLSVAQLPLASGTGGAAIWTKQTP